MILKDKVAIVIGASRGIGLETAKLFLKEGAKVIGTYNNTSPDVKEIDFYKLDITNRDEGKEFVDKIVKKYEKIDVLVNNAGITADALTRKMTDEQFDKVIGTNLVGTFNVTRLIGPLMQEKQNGSIINVASIVGVYGNIGQVNYAASKSGIIGMTHTWAKEFAMKGGNVRVNAVAPGYTMTDMLKTVPEELLDKFKDNTLLKRLAEPEDIANAILFLASDYSSYITDEVLNVNGGMKL
jgi:3-oxoacyl-[acyl-carrier protein] reductase